MELDRSKLLGFKLPIGQVTGAKIGSPLPDPDPKITRHDDGPGELDHSRMLGFKLPTGQVTGAKIGIIPDPDPKITPPA